MAGTTDSKTAAKDEEVTKFTVSRFLNEGYAITGYENHVVAGALHGIDDSKTFTPEEVQAKVKRFLATPVSSDTPSQED